ncbi:MAG: bifunctional hydroxymethylpyrimidine kinase/phosphomethylpyrimidine kinase, partial [Niameybacter sp.]
MKYIPRVAAIQDLSCFGRCSLSVIIPILSHMKVQVCPVPTAVFSTHTGGFGTPVKTDLTGMMHGLIEHWQEVGVQFDCIYSGFLSSAAQIEEVLIVVDPVMGDHGKLYKTYNEKMQQKMKHLVERADVITPNWTEASFLLHRPYSIESITEEEIKSIVKALAEMGPRQIV